MRNIGSKILRACLLTFALLFFTGKASAISFALDSIATWGKFPRFCVNTYRWGDKFFNTYDTTYVKPTGFKFNVKLTSESWIDYYRFDFEPERHMEMVSDIASNVGVHLTYMAVSVGYDMNINKFFNGYEKTRKRLNFAFNCALFGADIYMHNNDLTTTITSFGNRQESYRPDIKFDGASIDRWGFDVYYFLNNKKYSQAASFYYGRVQNKSQGSWYFGLSFCNQRYTFDFNQLPDGILQYFPEEWDDYTYRVKTKTYSLKAGYAYNWVLGKNWIIAVSESPMIGLRTGHVNSYNKRSVALNNSLRISAIYNHRNKRVFAGIVGNVNTGLITDPETTMIANNFTAEISIGYRFNLW